MNILIVGGERGLGLLRHLRDRAQRKKFETAGRHRRTCHFADRKDTQRKMREQLLEKIFL